MTLKNENLYHFLLPHNKTVGGALLTIRVVGVDPGVGGVPALNGSVNAPAEALLTT